MCKMISLWSRSKVKAGVSSHYLLPGRCSARYGAIYWWLLGDQPATPSDSLLTKGRYLRIASMNQYPGVLIGIIATSPTLFGFKFYRFAENTLMYNESTLHRSRTLQAKSNKQLHCTISKLQYSGGRHKLTNSCSLERDIYHLKIRKPNR